MSRSIGVFCVAIILLGALGCRQDAPPKALDFTAQLPPGTLALRKISPENYPHFSASPQDLPNVHRSIQFSLDYLAKPSSLAYYPYGDIDHARAVASLRRLDEIVLSASSGSLAGADIDGLIRRDFEVYQSVGAPSPDGNGYTGQVLFTGYFTPIYSASLTRQGAYQWPLYKRPADLISDPRTGDVQGRKTADGQIVPYYTRGQIESGALAGQELVWLSSRWEAYVVTVQGSGRLRLPDGKIYEVGYAGLNGYPYTPIAQKMKEDGVISADQISLKGLRNYFDAHPADLDKYLPLNQRTVFFTERPGGPFGKLNEPVTAFATIATDKAQRDIYPRAMPAFLMAPVPTPDGGTRPFSGFLMDQDAGGAIRAAGRCDIFMGIGERAEQLAGHELNQGQLYYIAIKPELVEKYSIGINRP